MFRVMIVTLSAWKVVPRNVSGLSERPPHLNPEGNLLWVINVHDFPETLLKMRGDWKCPPHDMEASRLERDGNEKRSWFSQTAAV